MSVAKKKCLRFFLSRPRLVILAAEKPPSLLQIAPRFSNRSFIIEQRRFQSTQSGKKSNFAGNAVKYAATIVGGLGAGLFTGYWLVLKQSPNVDKNKEFQPTKHVKHV